MRNVLVAFLLLLLSGCGSTPEEAPNAPPENNTVAAAPAIPTVAPVVVAPQPPAAPAPPVSFSPQSEAPRASLPQEAAPSTDLPRVLPASSRPLIASLSDDINSARTEREAAMIAVVCEDYRQQAQGLISAPNDPRSLRAGFLASAFSFLRNAADSKATSLSPNTNPSLAMAQGNNVRLHLTSAANMAATAEPNAAERRQIQQQPVTGEAIKDSIVRGMQRRRGQ